MRNLKILFSYLGAYRRDAILGVFFVSVETVLELFIPVIMANIIDVGVPAGDINYMLLQGAYMLVSLRFRWYWAWVMPARPPALPRA